MSHTLRYQHQDLELSEGEFIIGRASTCQLSLDDPLVSRRHARLVVSADSVRIEDLGSQNGVLVNGERIRNDRVLSHGDQIVIGGQEMVLQAGRDPTLDTRVEARIRPGNLFGILGILAEKALALGRAEEAERLVADQLWELLAGIEAGRAALPDTVERASTLAVRLAGATADARWTDYAFRAYAALGGPCPTMLVDELYTVMRRVKQPHPRALRAYLEVLRGRSSVPAERFLLSRLEGLDRLLWPR